MDVVRKDIKARGGCGHHWGWGHRAWSWVGGELHMAKAFALRHMAKAACSWGQAEAIARWLKMVVVTAPVPVTRPSTARRYARGPKRG